MRRAAFAVAAVLVFVVPLIGLSAPAQAAGCGLGSAAFCDTFDAPAGTGNRSGDLNGTIWGVSRFTGIVNLGQGEYDAWSPTPLELCGATVTVQPPNDVRICNGQLREATNDNGNVTVLAMYPKQPFDFAGRTGTVVFDVSNDTQGVHGAWPELWITDKPIPAPFTHFSSWITVPRNGFGIRFAADAAPGTFGICPNADNTHRVTVDSAIVARNYVVDDSTQAGSTLNIVIDGCVVESPGPDGPLNHFEVKVSQSRIDVYGTDAGSATLVHLATITNPNLQFTRGLVWIEDVHYNAIKARQCGPVECGAHREHTFTWDNVGFDGPFTYRDLSFDVPDALVPAAAGTVNLGWLAPVSLNTLPMTSANIAAASGAALMFNFFNYTSPLTLDYAVNGHAYTAAWPYPDTAGYTPRTITLPVNLADLVAGPNAVTISASQAMVVANVNIVLVAVGGGLAATPTPMPTATPAPTPVQTPSPAPTVDPSVAPSVEPTSAPAPTPVPTSPPNPMPTGAPTPAPAIASSQPTGVPTAQPGSGMTATVAPRQAEASPTTATAAAANPAAAAAGAAVALSASAFHASWVSQSTYPSVTPGGTAQMTVRYRNTGTASWVRGVPGQQANLGLSGDGAGLAFDWPTPDRLAVQTEAIVPPGGVGTFTFQIRAPSTTGQYRLAVRPVIDGTTWMEDQGTFFIVNSRALGPDALILGLFAAWFSDVALMVTVLSALVLIVLMLLALRSVRHIFVRAGAASVLVQR